ncbi:MAG TPA: HEAT repeat domain-containing protein [Nitrospiraceae bacterium]|nr:HEAT repeat domain-containing protein [Nitrospiraceae bacterium]
MADSVLEQIAALKDEDWAVREEAAATLGAFRDARAVGPLVQLLGDEDRAVREASRQSLTAIGEAAVPALGRCLEGATLTVQESAASILATIGDIRVLDVLISALISTDWIVRMHAAKGLGRIADPRSVSPLMPLLQDKVKAVRVEASEALSRIGQAAVPPLLEALQSKEWLVKLHAIEALGKMRSRDTVEPLLSVLFNDPDTAVRTDAVRALGDIGDSRAVDFLLTALNDLDVRPVAVESLGKIGDRRAVPALVKIVNGSSRPDHSRPLDGCGDRWDQEMIVMGFAVRALGDIGDETAIPALIAALRSTVTRSESSTALTRFGRPAIPYLLEVVKKERDENIVYYAKEALSQLGWRVGRIQ